jgi:hypothetical protein
MFEHRGEAWRVLMMKTPQNAKRKKGGKGIGKAMIKQFSN